MSFRFIYFEDWVCGHVYHMKDRDGAVSVLGRLVSKTLIGPRYDPDMLLMFERDGKEYKHVVGFENTYAVDTLAANPRSQVENGGASV